MATTPNKLITPQTIGNGLASLVSPTAITSRARRTGTSGLVLLKGTTTNGSKVYEIKYKGSDSTTAGSLCIWRYNGTSAHLEDELIIGGVGVATWIPSESSSKTYDNLALGPTESLYVSVTEPNDLTVYAQCSDL